MKIVHFDLKPDNLLLEAPLVPRAGLGVPAVKVADFGLSKHKWKSYVSGVRDLRCAAGHCRECRRVRMLACVGTVMCFGGCCVWMFCFWQDGRFFAVGDMVCKVTTRLYRNCQGRPPAQLNVLPTVGGGGVSV